ncbi:DUF1684 domain-containing protein [Arthrobacter mobilis]|uniref:DUF1684 domain-containing protein n=1 Tax=Arthrobacter mobilis TaxID=2724944 RepID=A0A7X6K799_9MICC|nr:DUF1684 domain-containing protein [Arthrobacter mobilis]NKX56429.1 DUF1684 domain-containing protein [Arthrobacter mobilis]
MTSLENEVTTAEADWYAWRRAREDALAADFGWLSLTSFQRLGPEAAEVDQVPGLWSADEYGAALSVRHEDEFVLYDNGRDAVGELTKALDERGQALWVMWTGGQHDVIVELLRRDHRYLIRTREEGSVLQQNFSGVPTFEYSPEWVVKGSYTAFAQAVPERVPTARADVELTLQAVGEISFQYRGATHRLAAEALGGGLRIGFRDQTNGSSTPAWRYLDAAPAADGAVVLDFNRALAYPFAFSGHTSCPAPFRANQLPFPVTAGEKAPGR